MVGIDASARLLEVARKRAHTRGVDVDFREGDLLELPLTDGAADLVLSVFGLIFAPDPALALSLWIKSLLGVLTAQVGVPKLPRHAQGDRIGQSRPDDGHHGRPDLRHPQPFSSLAGGRSP